MNTRRDDQSHEHGDDTYLVEFHYKTNMSQHYKNPLEHDDEVDEDEEEDVDFNPFLRGSPSAEACSILSSEVDGSDGEVVESCAENVLHLSTGSSSNLFHNGQFQDSGDAEHDEASVLHTEVSFQQNGCEEAGSRNSDKRKLISSSGLEDGPVREKDNGPTNETEVAGNVLETEVESPSCRKPIIDFDNDDAICKRTRAHYSLTGITLDELETFLQETDDDDDLQRIDDEEEYRKFLAAVLHGGPQDDRASPEEGNDEDEDDDADFEIEIEEALASDLDIDLDLEESWKDAEGRRPETRQNKHNNSSKHHREKLLEVVKRPLRPLLPVLPSLPIAPVPCVDGSYLMPEAVQSLFSPQELVNGFLPHQIGQLYCLLHDHVQLLVQVYSLSVLDPSRQHIASQIQGLLSEMVQKRDEILAQRSVPHPSFCFQFHYCHSLRTDGLQLETSGSSKKHRDSGGLSSSDCSRQVSGIPSDEICAQSTPGSPDPSRDIEGFRWLPFVSGSVFSVLDVAPLKLVGKYMEDVSTAVHEHRRRFLEATTSMDLEKEPLFPLPVYTSFLEASGEAGTVVRTSAESTLQASSPSPQRPSKKTLAATLVENTKKECVALVPKPIARLALRFYPLLNPTLFPHKPPPSPVANRLLFTDVEDELLAMGMMEYNTDWKLIQQRFLPCKTKHQIFVRQKNRCTSKAPDNPIKAVRRMKTAPLTENEKVHIHEALKVFKWDWISVWKFVVPYRDPSLLPRQWRIATGTQKSYRMDSAKREKRRLYDLKRRKRNTAIGNSSDLDKEIENAGRKKSAKRPIHKESEAYVHEGFLRDWRPPYARSVSFPISASVNHSRAQSSPYSGQAVVVRNKLSNDNQGQTSRGHTNELATSLNNTTAPFAGTSNSVSNGQAPRLTLNQPYYRPYRARRRKSSLTVKLAPDLPPIHLPPSVRVISQTAFRSSHDGRNVESSGPSHGEKVTSHVTPKQNVIKALSPKQMMVPSQEGASSKQGCNPEGCTGSDFLMHPLMFNTGEGGNLPYYPLNYNGMTLSAFTFFPVNAPLTTVQNPGFKTRKLNCSRKSTRASSGVDFHPLLKSCETGNNNSFGACQTASSPASLELSRNTFSESRSVYNGGTSAAEFVDKARDATPVVANGLNLEINLNSAATYEKDLCRENWGQGNLMASPVTAVRSDDGAKSTQGIQANDGAGFDCEDTMCSQSPPEIVMEQEELSDSDEEIEDVEFEREEMTDSEGEEEDEGKERGVGGGVCEIEQFANAHNQGNQEVSPIRDGSRLGPDLWKDKVPACSHSPVSEDNGPWSPWLSLSSLASRSTLPSGTAKCASGSLPR
ncbi:hypothetical protein Droror1_Dr00019254 [Drosera rotundifolia]